MAGWLDRWLHSVKRTNRCCVCRILNKISFCTHPFWSVLVACYMFEFVLKCVCVCVQYVLSFYCCTFYLSFFFSHVKWVRACCKYIFFFILFIKLQLKFLACNVMLMTSLMSFKLHMNNYCPKTKTKKLQPNDRSSMLLLFLGILWKIKRQLAGY